MMVKRPRRCADDRGAVLEAVILVPLILTMFMMVAQFAIAAYTKQVLNGAVQDGAAEAALLNSSDGQGLATAEGLMSSASGWVSSHGFGVNRTEHHVTMEGHATVIKVFPLMPTIRVSASAAAAIEQWEAP